MRNKTAAIELRADVWDAGGGRCHYCGKAMHPIRDFTVDHVIPRSRGGTDESANLVAACWECNCGKNNRLVYPDPGPKPSPRRAPEPRPAPKPALSVAQAARRLAVDQKTLRKWADAGYVPHVRTAGGQRRFEPDVIGRLRREGFGGNANEGKRDDR